MGLVCGESLYNEGGSEISLGIKLVNLNFVKV